LSRDTKIDRLIATPSLIAPSHRYSMGSWSPGDVPPRFDHATPHPCPPPAGPVPALAARSEDRSNRRGARVTLFDHSAAPREVPPRRPRRHRARLPSSFGRRGHAPRRGAGGPESAPRASDLGGRPDPGASPSRDAGAGRPLGPHAPTLVRTGRPVTGPGGTPAAGRTRPVDPAPRDLADGCKGTYPITDRR
jgi:hypothetical protein